VRFNRYFANCDAEQFIDDVLIKKIECQASGNRGMIFHFGKANGVILPCSRKRANFMALVLRIPVLPGRRVTYKQHPYQGCAWRGRFGTGGEMLGTVIRCAEGGHGDKRGRTIGYPLPI